MEIKAMKLPYDGHTMRHDGAGARKNQGSRAETETSVVNSQALKKETFHL